MIKKDHLLTQSEFAKNINRTRQAINLAIKSGLLPAVEDDGKLKINPSDYKVIKYAENKSGNRLGKKKPKKDKVRQTSKQKKKQKIEVGQTYSEKDISAYIKKISDTENFTPELFDAMAKSDFDKLKVWEEIKFKRTKTQKERKELLSRKLVRVVFGKLYEIDVNEFLTLKSKVVPDLAGIFECTNSTKMIEAEKRIDTELWKILKHIKLELDKFLKKQGSEKIEEVNSDKNI